MDELRVDKRDRVATLTIDRPQRRNALSRAVVVGLTRQIQALGEDPDVGVIVITGAGEKTFCAGGDLGDQVGDAGPIGMHHDRGAFVELLRAQRSSTRPLIARVNGHALGGGFGLALGCDLVVAAEHATFGMPEIKVGLFPMMIMAVVSRNIGRKAATELMLTGERISAAKALEYGVANRAVPADELDATVDALADRIAGFSPAILRLGREAFYRTQDMGFDEALYSLHAMLTVNALSEDTAEGVTAFFSGRAPEWKGR
jgi:enoyl-CoA hydratase/carnithine racemase